MKYIVLSVLCLVSVSCSQASKPQNAAINGKMESLFNNWIYLVKPDPWSGKSSIIDSTQITNEGVFTFSVDEPTVQEYIISGKGYFITSLFVRNGFDLNLDITGSNNKYEIVFSGEGAKENSFWQKMTNRFYQNGGYNDIYRNLVVENDAVDFLKQWTTYSLEQKAVIDSFNKKNKSSKDFVSWTEGFWLLNSHAKYYTYLFQKPQMQKSPIPYTKVGEGYYEFKKEVNFQKMKPLPHSAYNDYLYVYLLDYRLTSDNPDDYEAVYNYAKEDLKGEAAELAAASVIKDLVEKAENNDDYLTIKKLMADFETWSSDPKYATFLSKKYAAKAVLAPGSPAPDFTFENPEGKMISLSDYKGKVVVIDFWGTWCGPCKKELPFSKEIEAFYADRDDVVFLFVALERGAKESWLSFIRQNQIPGVHMFTQGQTPSLAPYKISSVPRYVLIDKNGAIYNAYASRPSQNMQSQIQNVLDSSKE